MKYLIKSWLGLAYDSLEQIYYSIECNVNLIRFRLSRVEVPEYKDILIIINNRNRLTFLKRLVDDLHQKGYNNIIILDNDSTYQPLLDYYHTKPCKIIMLNRNLGFNALEQIPLYKEICKNYFVYTDPDVLPCESCPPDFLNFFLETLLNSPQIQKVGFSLKIDNLPDCFKMKQKVIEWESKYFRKRVGDLFFSAPIDTTFALHRPYAKISTKGRLKMLRTDFPYEAYHLPWYNDSENISDEEQYYIDHVEIGTHWSRGIEVKRNILFLSFFKKCFKISR